MGVTIPLMTARGPSCRVFVSTAHFARQKPQVVPLHLRDSQVIWCPGKIQMSKGCSLCVLFVSFVSRDNWVYPPNSVPMVFAVFSRVSWGLL